MRAKWVGRGRQPFGSRGGRRLRRYTTVLSLIALLLGVAVTPADAAQMQFPAIHLPSLAQIAAWFESPHWGWLPAQASGTAAGKSHDASAASTRAGSGSGHAPGKGLGQNAAYSDTRSTKTGKSAAGKGVFNAKTSTRVAAKSTAYMSWYQNADGSYTKQISEYPVNYQTAAGWVPIDASLAATGGRLTEKANSLGVSFAARSGTGASATGQFAHAAAASTGSDLVDVTVGTGESVGWSLSGASAVTGTVSGSTVSYPAILPGTTLAETAGPGGAKESIVLASSAAGNSWTFPLDVAGLAPSLDAEGAVQFKDASGAVAARIPLAFAYDSKVNQHTGDPAETWGVKYSLAQTDGGWALTVTVDSAWLNDSARVFPVTVDPTMNVSIVGTTSTTYTTTDATGDYSSDTVIKTGECTSGACGSQTVAHGYVDFANAVSNKLDNQGYGITAASLNLFDTWTATSIGSASCTTANASSFTWSTVYVAPITQDWSVTGAKTDDYGAAAGATTGPDYGSAIGSAAPATWNACTNTGSSVTTGDWVSIPITDLTYLNGWSFGTQPDYGLAVYGATGALTWRKYDSDVETSYTPYLSVTYADQAPQINTQYPANGYDTPTLTPELLASASRPSGSTTTAALQYDFLVYNSAGTKIADSGLISSADWSVPAGVLSWSNTYYWTVQAYDGVLYSVAPATSSLVTAVPQPLITSGLSQNSNEAGFDASSGNYTTSATDATVQTVGPALDVVRDYNALDGRTAGAFGAAWSSIFDARAAEQYNASGAVVSVQVTYPDGSQVGFGRNPDGTFSAPSGRFAVFKQISGGYALTDKQDTTYKFTQSLGSGGYGITSIADANNRAETFTWTSGYITAITSGASGRALHLTWATPATGSPTAEHVASVYTDPVTGTSSSTDLTWTYNYTGDQLTSACPPTSTTACTVYAYTTGSQYQTAALDAGAQSYWRLGESAGAAATSPTQLANAVTTSTGLGMCLDDTGAATADHTKIQVWQCLGDASQKWTLTTSGGAITWGGKCLDVTSSGTANGTLVQLYTCNSSSAQQWTWGSNGSLVNVNSGKCLDDPSSSTSNGTQLQIYTCNGTGAQNWGRQVPAASAVTANEGNDTAAYSGVTLGATGPLTGSTATAAAFDGIRSYVSVPNALVTGAGYLSVSLWFKTSSSGPLWCEQNTNIYTASPGNATCSLYVGTDGKLRGAWYQGATTGLASTATVSDGAWHHAVLSGAGSTQSLYLDGALVGTLAGTINNLAQTYGYIGAGWSSDVWPDTTASAKNWYFTGSISDVAFYSKALMASDVSGLYKAGTHSAALMTKITRPSGKVYATVAYDAVSARATSVVDANGGTWTINSPTVVGTSLAYRAAVLGSQPTGYYRLGDTAGATTAYDEVNYGNATYTNVTLGGSGPFSDTTSAAFDGSSSYMTLPSTDQVSTGPNTVEMWFKMNAGSKVGGTLFDEEQCALTVNPTCGGYNPSIYVGTDDRLHGEFWINSIDAGIVSTQVVNDGKWHHVVLSAGTNTQTMYLDGNSVGTVSGTLSATALGYIYVGAGESGGGWPNHPKNTLGYFPGSIAELAFYRTQLSAATVSAHYAAYSSGVSGVAPTEVATVTDPGGKTLTYRYDLNNGSRQISETDGTGATTSYGYDSSGFLYTSTDANGNVTATGHDAQGNAVSQSTCQNQAANVCSTEYYTYKADTTNVDYAKSATVTTSGNLSSTNWNNAAAVDGNTTSVAGSLGYSSTSSTSATTTDWIQLDLGSAKTIDRVDLYPRTDSVGMCFPKAFTIQISADGSTWTTVTTQTNYAQPTTPAGALFSFTAQSARYVKVTGTTLRADSTSTYYMQFSEIEALNDQADPTAGLTLTSSDGRSSSAADTTYQTTYTYDAAGDRTAVTTPAVAGSPSGRTTTITYSDGTSAYPAADSGNVPAGLPMTTVSPGGSVSRVAYFHNGDVASTTDADGQVTTYTYDGVGRVLTKTVNPGSPTGWWQLSQTSGTAVPDASGVGNGATASNVTWSGGVGVFNGTSSKITTAAPVINTAASYSVSAWVNLSSIPAGYASPVGFTGNNDFAGQLQYSPSAGSWEFQTTAADVGSATESYYTAAASTAPTAGAWYHLVGVYDASAGTDTLYVNGAVAATANAPKSWTASKLVSIGSLLGGNYFPGSIANVQVYQRALPASDVTAVYGAGYAGTTVAGTTPNGLVTSLTYDGLGEVTSQTDPTVTDRITGAAHTATTTTVYDVDGDVTSQTVADTTTGGDSARTVSATYNAYDEEATSTDARNNATSFTYDSYGNKTGETGPDGTVTSSTYDAAGKLLTQTLANYTGDPVNPSSATTLTEVSKSYDPAGRLASSTDSMGNITSYTYTDNGLVASVTRKDSNGANPYVVQANTYDAAGNLVKKVTGNGSLTTTYAVDAANRTTQSVVDPTGTDRATTVSYTPDDSVATSTETDSGGWDRTAKYTYDAMGNKTSQSVNLDATGHPVGWWQLSQTTGSSVTDASGTGNTANAANVAWTGSGGGKFNGSTSQVATNGPVLNTAGSYSVSAWVDPASLGTGSQTVASQSGSVKSAFILRYDGSTGKWSFGQAQSDVSSGSSVYVEGTSTPAAASWTMLTGVYNVSTGLMQLYVNGVLEGTATNTTPFAANGAFTIGHDLWNGAGTDYVNGQIQNVQAYSRTLSATEIASLYSAGQTGGTVASSSWQTTSWHRDVRGLPTSSTDPNGNTTSYTYDEAGHLAVTVAPTVSSEQYGSATVSVHPTSYAGYNTFGEQTESKDADGNVTTTVYDANGNKVSQTLPSYTAPGASSATTATEVWTYDQNNSLSSDTDALGKTTNYVYDQLGDEAKVTTPDGGITHTTYDTNGDALSTTDPTGAQTQATYDWLGRQLTQTTLERYPTAQTLTSTNSYASSSTNPGGSNLASTTSPDGAVTSYGYDAAGDKTSSTDPSGNTTKYSYTFMGDPYITTYADGTYNEVDYNAAQLPTATKSYDASGNLLTSQSAAYDASGNLLSSTDARGNTSTYTYDSTNTLTQEIQPVSSTSSITTSFGYDAAGNQTRFTDGRGNNWYTTYNNWGLKETQVEPTTSTYTTAAASTTTYAYNADAQLATETLPGGATQSFSYNTMGDLLTQSGSGAAASTATRSFGYDLAGRVTSAATSNTSSTSTSNATTESFTYDDRSNLLTATGTAGSTTLAYNGDSLLTSRADASGTTSFTYDSGDRVSTATDAATGTTLTYGYNTLDQLSSVAYGSSGDTRSYTYDALHRLTGDTLKTSASATVASIAYGYDANNNLTSKSTTGFGTSAANTYTYDYANRLTNWNNGSTNTAYSYDAAGNRTQVGSNVYTYDARDQLTSDGVNSYTYTAYGTLAGQSSATATNAYSSDAYGQEVTAGVAQYTYDAMGRAVSRTDTSTSATSTLQYSGTGNTVASDGSYTYSRDAEGSLLGVNTVGGTTSTGKLLLTDLHTDVVGDFAATGTALSGATAYDPFGNTVGTSTKLGNLGYQSEYTDSSTGQVNMAARWYNPATGQFASKDTVSISPVGNSANANPFAYAADDPMTGTDPSGHCWFCVSAVTSAWHAATSTVSSAWNATTSFVSSAWDDASNFVEEDFMRPMRHIYNAYVAPVVHAVVHLGTSIVHHVRDAYHRAYHWVNRQVHRAWHAVRHAYHAAVHYVKTAYHATVRAVKRAYHAAAKAVHSAVTFVKHHAAAIASFALSTVAFMGCEAVLGAPTGGVGAVAGAAACGAFAGMVGGLVDQGAKCIDGQKGGCSVGSFVKSGLIGGVVGAAGGALGSLGGKVLGKLAPKALDAIGGLFGKGSSGLLDSGASDATSAAETRAATESAESGVDNTAQASKAADDTSGENGDGESEGSSCRTDTGVPHSFVGSTQVLMADGATKSIDQIKVGDQVADAVPGQSGTQSHTVTAVIVTKTDHDFVNVGIAPLTTTAKATPAKTTSAKTTTGKTTTGKTTGLKKAAIGLAAALAAVTATIATAQSAAASTAHSTITASAAATSAAGDVTEHGGTLTTTFHHPFYDETQAAFVDAQHLKPGDVLQTPAGTAEVTTVHLFHADTVTYDLTIGDLHTYYVEAGTTPVLVHNHKDPQCGIGGPGPHANRSIPARSSARDFTKAERDQVKQFGTEDGCHTCGSTSSGRSSGNFTLDHQPVSALNVFGWVQRLYPQCAACSNRQGGLVSAIVRRWRR